MQQNSLRRGGKIVFNSDRDNIHNSAGFAIPEIYVMNADGSDQTRLTHGGGDAPNLSADDKKIAFASSSKDGWEIYSMNADGSNVTRLTKSTVDDYGPSWSPDGTKIAFSESRNGNDDIYVMNSEDGSGIVRLTNRSGADGNVRWSPDGKKVVLS